MASQVLSGTGNVSYTNNTGQNVRVIINYCSNPNSSGRIVISWAGVSVTATTKAFGRNLAFLTTISYVTNSNNMEGSDSANAPTELMLAPGQTFSLSAGSSNRPNGPYNIVVIPEAG